MEQQTPPRNATATSRWLDDFFATYYRRRPVNATFTGIHAYDDRLPDWSAAGLDAAMAEMEAQRRALATLPSEALDAATALDRDLAAGFLDIALWEYGSPRFQRGNPSMWIGEAVFGLIGLFLRPFAPLDERVGNAVARLEAIPTFLAQGRALLTRCPAAWVERALVECTGTLAFLSGGVDILIADHGLAATGLRHAADRAARAVTEFADHLTSLLEHPHEDYACGEEALDLLLRRGHFLERSTADIAAAARAQMAASRAVLDAGASAFGAASPDEALAGLSALHPTTNDYYARYAELWDQSRAAARRADLITWPEAPVRYIPRPAWARAAAPALYFLFYRSPAPYDPTTPLDYLVTPIDEATLAAEQDALLRANNDSVIKLNHVVHHGGIGHHIQNWHAARAASRVGRVAAVDCASRIAFFCGGTMAEGWACYTTELMAETDFLSPLERYEGHYARLRMAARALVDVDLHTGRLSLDEATAVYRDEVGMSPAAARSEAARNSMYPGAALMYLIGTDMIHALRKEHQERLGAAFNLRAFHDRFLSYGSIPVSLIGAAMRQEDAHAPAQ